MAEDAYVTLDDLIERGEARKDFVRNCARCHRDHDVIFVKFSGEPIEDSDGKWDYWGTCPYAGDPILMRVEKIDPEK